MRSIRLEVDRYTASHLETGIEIAPGSSRH
jgi:hypothetical protein